MKRIRLLLKYFVGNSFNNSSTGIKNKNLAMLFYVFIIIAISMPIAGLVDSMYPTFAAIGQEGYVLSFIFLIGSLTLLILGIYDILDSFFFSQDIEPMMSLPFTSSEIMICKFITCLIDMYVYLLITILPLISFGLNSNGGFSYFLMAIPVYLFAPIVVIILCILIIMVLMSFINISKYQNVFKGIFGTLGIVFMAGIYLLNSAGISQENVTLAMSEKNGLVELTNKALITNTFSVKALLYSDSSVGLMNLGLLIIVSVMALIIAYMLGKIMYNKILSKNLSVYSERENIFEKHGDKVIVSNSKKKAIVLKELRTIFRDPSNFINCVVMLIYMPVLLFVFLLKGDLLSDKSQEFRDIIILGVTFLATALTISGNAAAATALSREGKEIFVSKYIPVDYKTQIHAKIIVSLMINGLVLILGIILTIYLKASPTVIIMSLLIQIVTIILISLAGILLDYSSPKLDWVDTKNLYSKNFKPLIIMFACLLVGLANLGLMVTKSIIIIFLVDIILLSVVSFILYKILMKTGLNLYKKV